ncbi:MAG: hypothetical protein IJI06_08630, partial [Oscillospiraceae bacterium]|nr:hypothetical protein [Oscillospiraceae bacterium]
MLIFQLRISLILAHVFYNLIFFVTLLGGVFVCRLLGDIGLPHNLLCVVALQRGLDALVPDLLHLLQAALQRAHGVEDLPLGRIDLGEGIPDLVREVLDKVGDLFGKRHVLAGKLADGLAVQ